MILYTSAREAVAWLESLDGDEWCRYFETVHVAHGGKLTAPEETPAEGPAP